MLGAYRKGAKDGTPGLILPKNDGEKIGHNAQKHDECLLCTVGGQRKEWPNEFIKALKIELNTLDTAADTRNTIAKGLEQWMNKQSVPENPQDALRWNAFIKGYIHKHWVEQQDSFYA
jgi:hypothetical protein